MWVKWSRDRSWLFDYYSRLRKLSQAEMLLQTRPLWLELALQWLVIEFPLSPLFLLTRESLTTNGFPMSAANDLERKGLIWIIILPHICCEILKVLALIKNIVISLLS